MQVGCRRVAVLRCAVLGELLVQVQMLAALAGLRRQ